MKRRFPVVGATLALTLAITAGLMVPTASPAKADVPIFGPIFNDVTSVLGIVNQIKSAYDKVIQYLTDPARPPSELDQIKAAITQSATAINSQIDATATAEVKTKCDNIVIEFEDIGHKTGTDLENFRNAAVDCVNAAKNQIHAEVDPQSLDANALALNVGAPIALAASVKAGDATDLVLEAIEDGNRALLANPHLKPTCGFTPNAGVDVEKTTNATTGPVPGTGGEAPIPGHGACFNYRATAPKPTEGNVLYFPTGPNTGALPWTVTGDGHEDFCSVVFTCGHAHVDWPSTAQWDFSAAVDQAMAATSYPIAEAGLDKMAALVGPVGQPVTMVAETATNETEVPIDVFGVTPAGQVVRGVLADSPNDFDTYGAFAHDTFGGWTSFGDLTFVAGAGGPGYTVKSLASTVTWDGRVQVFAVDRIGNVFSRWQLAPKDDARWSRWTHLDGALNSIAVARNQDGRLQLFGTTPDGTVLTRYQMLNIQTEFAGSYVPQDHASIHPAVDAWTAWQPMDVNSSMKQVTAATAHGQIHLYALDRSGSFFERHENAQNAPDFGVSGNWSGWTAVPGPSVAGSTLPLRSVQAFVDFAGRTNLLVIANGSLQYQEVVDFTGWAQIPGSMYGGFGVTKEGGGAGGDEMFGVDRRGNVYYSFSSGLLGANGVPTPGSWSPWSPVGSGALRAYEAGPDAGPVLENVQPAAGKTTLTWTDKSTNEDGFAVFRYTTGGRSVSEAADRPTTDKVGTGKAVTFTDTTPNANAPCYQVDAYDIAGLFVAASDVVCRTPGVLGLTQAAATSAITAAGFTVTVSTVNNCVNTGTVRAQSPSAANPAAWNSPVNVTVSTCTKTVPKLIGLSQPAAASAITAAGLKVGTVSAVNDCVNPGTVWLQNPIAGTAVAPGSAVDIKIFTCIVPNVSGLTQAAATSAITVTGLTVGTVSTVRDCTHAGIVQSQRPAAGTAVAPDATVDLTVAVCTVPDVVGLDQASAHSTIVGLGFTVAVSTTNTCVDPGTVQSQSPSAGTVAAPGSAVSITVSACDGGGDPK